MSGGGYLGGGTIVYPGSSWFSYNTPSYAKRCTHTLKLKVTKDRRPASKEAASLRKVEEWGEKFRDEDFDVALKELKRVCESRSCCYSIESIFNYGTIELVVRKTYRCGLPAEFERQNRGKEAKTAIESIIMIFRDRVHSDNPSSIAQAIKRYFGKLKISEPRKIYTA